MSGDVQPRRRKDKRRKKEEEDVGTPPPMLVSPSADPAAENLTIHVHKEGGTGGHWCARIIFFSLLAILVGLIGVILIEHRGAADVDTPIAESRWATVFDGWVDDVAASHDQADNAEKIIDHELEEDEEEEKEDDDDEQQEEGSEEAGDANEETAGDSEEDDNAAADLSEENNSDETENGDRREDDLGSDSYNEAAESREDGEEGEALSVEEENIEEKDQDGSEELEDNYSEENNDDNDENEVLEEVEANTSGEDENLLEKTEDAIINESDNDVDASIEGVEMFDVTQNEDFDRDEVSMEFLGIPGVNEIDDNSAEPLEEVEEEEPEEIVNEAEIEAEVEEVEEESSSGLKAPKITQSASDNEPKSSQQLPKTAAKQGGAREYEHDDITNIEDAVIREELDAVKGETAEKRIAHFTALLSRHPKSPRARYGLAEALDNLAEEKKQNTYLRRAIAAYQSVLELETLVPPKLFWNTGERCIDRLRFSGQYSAAESVHKSLIARFNDQPSLRNQLAVTYLIQNKLSEARKVLQETLGRWPNDGFALVHYGFILKTGDGNMRDAIMYLKAGIDTAQDGTIDGRFFFHLGDALVRLGRAGEAQKVYQTAAEKGLFLSAYQRSLYNVDHLTARPWWTLEQTTYNHFFNTLENNWGIIKAEGLAALDENGRFKNEAENLRDKGDWKQFELYARGHKIVENCAKVPRTCSLVAELSAAAGCRRGQIKFSVMYPGTHVWPHCGPTNCRLRAHLGLSGTEGTFIRVGNETRTWKEGSVMVFDDSFEHEVWHNGTSTRLVLIVDVWHPELNESERRALPAI